MTYLKKFASHLPTIDLSAIKTGEKQIPAPASPPVIHFTWLDHSSIHNENDTACFTLADLHQNFIRQQTEVYQSYLEKIQLLHQQLFNTTPHKEAFTSLAPISPVLPGPKFDRADLEKLAGQTISTFFGDWFKPLDQYEKLIRMPQPPLLLTDKVLGIEGVPGSRSKGIIWTETTVRADAWYLHQGRMPAGIMIEAGQSDLLLASWLGFDFHNQGQRVYRLLGCEASFSGEYPKVDDVLSYEIRITHHARQGDIIIFFFEYDCKVNGEIRLRVRNGQAGFFNEEELKNSGGVLWQPGDDANNPAHFSPALPKIHCEYHSFTKTQLDHFSQGKTYECFGSGFELTQCHTRTPSINSGKNLFLDQIVQIDLNGGPWKRGYLKAIQSISPDDWFFKGHFKNDPCMPGTLIFEASLQAAAFYFTYLGYTVDKDGWRFEIAPDESYKVLCRGQITPETKEVVYEVFVCGIQEGPVPILYVDLLCTADGVKAFHTRCGLRIVPDWPLVTMSFPEYPERGFINRDGFEFNYHSLLACALGKPSEAFGESFSVFDNHRQLPRLPGPPYHFMSRILDVQGELGSGKTGMKLRCEYRILKDEWYFNSNFFPVMPFSVLLEIGLQPCGWLSSFSGTALNSKIDLYFRNLSGTFRIYHPIYPEDAIIETEVVYTRLAQAAGVIVQSFIVKSFIADQLIFEMETTFGSFPKEAFDNQTGIPFSAEEKAIYEKESNFTLDLLQLERNHFHDTLKLPDKQLLMIDKIDGLWINDKNANSVTLRSVKEIKAEEWFFKSHFFSDPVQPGSLGIEAMLQLVQIYILHTGIHQKFNPNPVIQFVPDHTFKWKYQGQVVPKNKLVTVIANITSLEENENEIIVYADSSLWVDGIKIYHAQQIRLEVKAQTVKNKPVFFEDFTINPAVESWVKDHCPNYVMPTLPMMFAVNMLAEGVEKYFPQKKLTDIQNAKIHDWVVLNKKVKLTREIIIKNDEMALANLYLEKQNQLIKVASATLHFNHHYSITDFQVEPLLNAEKMEHFYQDVFFGESFHSMKSLFRGKNGASAILNAESDSIPTSSLNQLILDGSLHTIPLHQLFLWSDEIKPEEVAYPAFIPSLSFYGPVPQTGTVHCETRFRGFYLNRKLPKVEILMYCENKLWARLDLVLSIFSKGKFVQLSGSERKMFLTNKEYVADIMLSSKNENGNLYLSVDAVKEVDWIPGSLSTLYEIEKTDQIEEITQQILAKEWLAGQMAVHPSEIEIEEGRAAFWKKDAEKKYSFRILKTEGGFIISPAD